MPKLRGLESGNGSSTNGSHYPAVFEVCLCPNGAIFAANVEKGCVDSARTSGTCNFTWNSHHIKAIDRGGARCFTRLVQIMHPLPKRNRICIFLTPNFLLERPPQRTIIHQDVWNAPVAKSRVQCFHYNHFIPTLDRLGYEKIVPLFRHCQCFQICYI